MTLIVCVDDRLGMAFNGRRQSRDKAVCQDMLKLAAESRLWIEEGSRRLFEGLEGPVCCAEDWTEQAQEGDFCFVENRPLAPLANKITTLVLYRWNRTYPADLRFDLPLENWRQTGVTEFPGTSHERITREVYVHE